MRILSITAQKPNSTGSGVYLTEVVKELHKRGHEQAVVAGVYEGEQFGLPEEIPMYPVCFEREELPFPIVGMSDEMPYRSTRYCDMTAAMTEQFEDAFLQVIRQAVEVFKPNLILCHHLYYVTALVREHFPKHKVYAFCHNTDLRQLSKTAFMREYILQQIPKLDWIFVPQKAQQEGVLRMFNVTGDKVTALGMGYNHELFHSTSEEKVNNSVLKIVFAGKIARKKGVASLIRSLTYLTYPHDKLVLRLAGSAGNREEYEEIKALAKEAPYPVEFLGRLPQEELARIYNASDIFVLPSFFDGLPLVVIEALACGNKVVVTDLPGVKEWLGSEAPEAPIKYVALPPMLNVDEPVLESLPQFERELASQIRACADMEDTPVPDLSNLSWGNICERIVEIS